MIRRVAHFAWWSGAGWSPGIRANRNLRHDIAELAPLGVKLRQYHRTKEEF